MEAITQKQKAAIHICVSELKWTRAQYIDWLETRYDVGSCMELTTEQAADAIEELHAKAIDERITDRQIGYIKFLWLSVDYAECQQGDTYLNNFLQRHYNAPSVEHLSRKQAFGCIAAIKKMQRNKGRKPGIKIDYSGALGWITLSDGTRIPTLTNSKLN